MRILVVSEGESLDSYVADDFGHAPCFLLVDSETLDYSAIINEFVNEEGAGMAVARAIVSLKVGIDVSSDEEGTVEEAVTDYLRRIERRKKFESQGQ